MFDHHLIVGASKENQGQLTTENSATDKEMVILLDEGTMLFDLSAQRGNIITYQLCLIPSKKSILNCTVASVFLETARDIRTHVPSLQIAIERLRKQDCIPFWWSMSYNPSPPLKASSDLGASHVGMI